VRIKKLELGGSKVPKRKENKLEKNYEGSGKILQMNMTKNNCTHMSDAHLDYVLGTVFKY
jgi:hypothetical protein